jgi:hypothetical protein
MSNIDKVVTDAILRDVKVYHFDTMLDAIDLDIDNFRKLIERHNLNDKESLNTLSALLNKQNHLVRLSREWIKAVGLNEYGSCRIVVLIEKEAAE